ncbi:NAD(P)-dependent oxidoreductase [Streptomyces jumonjinensis]|uniref:NAD(P)-dependent oxidoreductase n=1 Tax=Streptomyces jumonjinensis TaxID=1945 RepID=A0A646KM84_STRJU|nr:NAD(P)-binding domain-containing protein [Streptomyces jumonjinensis]MQT02086.1 NAD(P)-dependent oxidoreductase [Streptomyces jumonjinensis]
MTTTGQTGQTEQSAEFKQPVTVIGLGNLGLALADAFLAQGHPTTVWNRTPAKADGLVARGAVPAATPAEAVAASELVIVAVLDQATAHDILLPTAAALTGRTLVNLTSSTPQPARELAAWAAEQGAAYVVGAVYAVPQTIGTPEAFVLYSGDQNAFETHRDQLDLLGASGFVGTDAGVAPVYDMAVLSGMYGMFAGFFQAMALGRSERIRAADVTDRLVPWLKAAADALPGFAREIDSGDYATVTSSLGMNAVGLRNILSATESQGLGTALLSPLQALFDDQVAQGHGAASLSRAVESLQPRS